MVEYVVVTGATLGALLMPFGPDRLSALERLLDAIRQEHAGLLYAASVPALPGGQLAGGAWESGNGGTDAGGTVPGEDAAAPGATDAPSGQTGDTGTSAPRDPAPAGGEADEATDSGAHATGDPSPDPVDAGGDGDGDAAGWNDDDTQDDAENGGAEDDGTAGDAGNGDANCPLARADDPETRDQALFSASQRTGIVSTHVGNPIHVLTGNKYQREMDVQLPRLGLGFVRHYNSRSRHRGALGVGWTHGFETRLRDEGDRIVLWQGDGRRIDFESTHRQAPVRHFLARQHGDGRLSADPGGYQWRWRDGTLLEFGRDRALRLVRDPRGRQLRLLRDAAGRLVALRNDQGQGLELRYGADGRLTDLVGPAGVVARYAYDDRGRLVRAAYPQRAARDYHYEDPRDPHNLTALDVGGRRIGSWAYDEQDRGVLWRPADAARGLSLRFRAQDTQVIADDGSMSTYRGERRAGVPLVTAIEGAGCPPCASRDPVAPVSYVYNERLQLARVLAGAGRTGRAYEYDASGRLERILRLDPAGGTARVLLRVAYRAGADAVETVAIPSVKPGAEHLLRFEHDEQDRLRSLVESGFSPRPDGGYQPISRRRRFAYEHGALARVDRFRTGPEPALRVIRDRQGLPSAVRFDDGGTLRVLDRDGNGRPRRIQADAQAPLTLSYDADGLVESVHVEGAPSRGRLRLAYDERGRLRSIVRDPAGGDLATGTDSLSVPQGVSVRSPRALDPGGPAPHLAVDATGHLSQVTDANGATTRYGTDDFGRHVFTQSPDGGLSVFEHDEDGRLLRIHGPSNAQAWLRYDSAGRLVESRIADAAPTHFSWRADGPRPRLRRVEDATGAGELHDHDAAGRTRRTTIRIGDAHYSTSYAYDRRGRRIEQRLPDGRRLKFRYRDRGPDPDHLSAVLEARWLRDRPLISGLDEQPGAARLGWVAANGIRTVLQREHGRLARLRIGGLHDFSYRHDDRGRIVAIDDGGRPAARYRFDAQGRLDLALSAEALRGYRYDPNGNRVGRVLDGRHTGYAHAPHRNRLDRIVPPAPPWSAPLRLSPQAWIDASAADHPRPAGGLDADALAPGATVAVLHDADGRIVALGDLRFTYDANGQLVELRRRGRRLARYGYDSRGQRTGKQTFDAQGRPLAQQHYLYENGRLFAEADIDGTIRRQYLYLGRRPVALLTADTVYAVHSNHLGAPIAVTDSRRVVVWRARYAPFGRARVDEDPDADGRRFTFNLRLPGQYEDAESGLHYNGHRYYDPDLGRYLSADPLGLVGGLNPYAYAANDPVNQIDPTGLLLFAFDGTGNSDPPLERRDITNVVRFRDSYLHEAGELGIRSADGRESDRHAFYISGAATLDSRTGIDGDKRYDGLTGRSMIERIAALADDFFDHIAWHHHVAWFDAARRPAPELAIDIVGFSRGAASARVFANLLTAFLNGESGFVLDHGSGRRYDFTRGDPDFARRYIGDGCLDIELRFMGLFDTVPHYSANQPHRDLLGTSQDDDLRELDLAIPQADAPNAIGNVAHAVAANENRRDFHAISIHPHPLQGNTEARMEMGFIGAHADIGGGYSEGDLSDVAFMWMVQRAQKAGVRMDDALIARRQWNRVTSPVIHDSSDARFIFRDGRNFKYTNGLDVVPQRRWYSNFQDPDAYGMDYELSQQDFYNEDYRYGPLPMRGTTDFEGNDTLVGLLAGSKYQEWLWDNYRLDLTIDQTGLDDDKRPMPAR